MTRRFRLALGFLTILPVGAFRGDVTPSEVAGSRYFFPAIGLVIGAILAAASLGLDRLDAPGGPSCWALVALGVAITGGLHLDGLADTFDGLFLPGGPERRLGVMRDPHVGALGVAAVVLVLAGKLAALAEMGDRRRALALLGAAAASRSLLLLAAGSARYARPEGTGRAVIDAASPADAALAAILAVAFGAASCGTAGLLGAATAVVLSFGLTRWASRRLGGITGDILGAAAELSELVFLLVVGSW